MNKQVFESYKEVDELSLADIYHLTVKNKGVVLVCMIIFVLLAIVYILTVKPIYESSAVIQIGYIGRSNTLNGNGLINIEEPDILSRELTTISKELTVKLERDNKNNSISIIALKVQKNNPYKARESLTKITDELIMRHNSMFHQVLSLRKKHLNSLRKRLNTIQANFNMYDKKLSTEEKISILEIQSDLEEQVAEEELLLTEVYLNPSRLLKEPTLGIKPLRPNIHMSITIALILGFIIGVSLVCIIETINKYKSSPEYKTEV